MIGVTLYTDAELERLLSDPESDLAERKESWAGKSPETGRQAVCAFANDSPGRNKPGVLFVGVKDDGTPCGLPITDQLLLTLADIKTDGDIVPPPSIIVEKRRLKNADVAVVTVLPADAPPVRYKGRTWIRTGPRRDIATSQQEQILNEKRKSRDLPFDIQQFPSAKLIDIDKRLFEDEYLRGAFAADVLEQNDRSYEQKLASCRMLSSIEDQIPTVLGLLILGNRTLDFLPGAYIQFLRINDTVLSDRVVDEEKISGTIADQIRKIDEKIDSHNRIGVEIKSGNRERRTNDYPRVALQQIVRNALMHRTYENTNSPVRVTWFDDRIEVISPGGPYGIVNATNFGLPGYTDYRNPHIAEAMKVQGYVQRFGIGIQTAQNELVKNGNPKAEFTVEQSAIMAILRK